MKAVLAQARLPEGAERVALSLDDATRGPFVILTREGRFVTCLAPGMRVGDLPVVPRAELDRAARRIEALRERIARADAAGEGAAQARLIERLTTAGPNLCREEIEPLLAIAPFLLSELLRLHASFMVAVDLDRRRFLAMRGLQHVPLAEMRTFYGRSWALGHLAVLLASCARDLVEIAPVESAKFLGALGTPCGDTDSTGIALRGAWGVAKAGKAALAPTRAGLLEEPLRVRIIMRGVELTGIALRHAPLAAEIRKGLESLARLAQPPPGPELVRIVAAQMALEVMSDPERLREAHLRLGRTLYLRATDHLAPEHPCFRASAEEVEPAIAYAFAAQSDWAFLSHGDNVKHLFVCMPWVARASAVDLYLPRNVAHVAIPLWAPHVGASLVERWREVLMKPPSETRATPRRHEPCSCGSGRKFGKCCGR